MEKEKLLVTEEKKERVLLLGVRTQERDDTEESLKELEELVEAAGGMCAGSLIQSREAVHPGTYIGKGKIEEVRERLFQTEADGVVCDDELTPAQLKGLEEALETKVMDRTLVILDIFAARACTREGKVQVELAQLKYRLARLTGLGRSLSRLGGGIGTRGPGEKKLETDRRVIQDRIAQLSRELKEIRQHRDVARGKRQKNHMPVAAIVGYTNAGKSTLLNKLTCAGVLEEDKLFATLDPTTRILELPSRQKLLLTDTVGFIRKLPHHLVEAFRSTLEEAKYADLLIHVVDASNPQMEKQMHTVYEILHDLGAEGKPVLTLFNKQDKPGADRKARDFRADAWLPVSLREGSGLEEIKEILEELLRDQKILIERLFPYSEAGWIQQIRSQGELLEEQYREDGIFVRAYVPAPLYGQLG
jgi:GTP-binding protein HflX